MISDIYAPRMKELVENTEDINDLRIRLHIVNLEIQIESFGITWEGPGIQKKKNDIKKLNQLFRGKNEEMDKMLEEGYSAKDLNSQIYKVKEMINGPKIKAAEPICINDPVTGELRDDFFKKSDIVR